MPDPVPDPVPAPATTSGGRGDEDARPVRWRLPDDPRLSWLRKRAKRLHRELTAGDPDALALLAAYDPPVTGSDPVPLARAQRVLARAYGFPRWDALRDHLRTIEHWTRRPGPDDVPDDEPAADRFLRLAFLSYSRYDPADAAEARTMLDADPSLATASVWAMAACGRTDELTALLADRPELARAEGGPYRWSPLLSLGYARLGERAGDPVGSMRVLLAAGADPNAGFLWHALTSPFTALTGVFGGGERDEPVHPQSVELARLLLAAGADPNDNQTLYNRMFSPRDDHLELLFGYGLGEDRPSVWRDRLGDAYPSPTEMVGEQLRHAAEHGFADRVRLLLAHGVDPNTRGYHPILGDQTAYEVAVRTGHLEIADLLAAAGGVSERLDDVDALLSAALAGDTERVARLRETDPGLAARAVERQPEAMITAALYAPVEALPGLLELGFRVRIRRGGRTALHEAALAGRDEVVEWLLAHGADPDARDKRFDATPAGWADHAGHPELSARLAALESS